MNARELCHHFIWTSWRVGSSSSSRERLTASDGHIETILGQKMFIYHIYLLPCFPETKQKMYWRINVATDMHSNTSLRCNCASRGYTHNEGQPSSGSPYLILQCHCLVKCFVKNVSWCCDKLEVGKWCFFFFFLRRQKNSLRHIS